jgi:hypothetical protein
VKTSINATHAPLATNQAIPASPTPHQIPQEIRGDLSPAATATTAQIANAQQPHHGGHQDDVGFQPHGHAPQQSLHASSPEMAEYSWFILAHRAANTQQHSGEGWQGHPGIALGVGHFDGKQVKQRRGSDRPPPQGQSRPPPFGQAVQ